MWNLKKLDPWHGVPDTNEPAAPPRTRAGIQTLYPTEANEANSHEQEEESGLMNAGRKNAGGIWEAEQLTFSPGVTEILHMQCVYDG